MSRRAAIAILVSGLAGCGAPPEPYARVHDAALDEGGAAILLLVESGERRTQGSLFSGNTRYSASRLALWRLERGSGVLAEGVALPMPADFVPNQGQRRLARYGLGEGDSLPDCGASLTTCAVRRTPEPYVAEDLAGGVARGLQVIDPANGHVLRTRGVKLEVTAWPHRSAVAAAAAREAALASAVNAVKSAAEARLARLDAAPDRGASERGTTFIEPAAGAALEGLFTEYRVMPDDSIEARLKHGGDAPVRLRWSRAADAPGGSCETDRIEATRWVRGCRYVTASQALDPELAYLESVRPRLQAEAQRDATYQSARRGTTFGLRSADADAGYSWVGCVGVPGSRVGGCDADRGDSACTLRLPVLCVLPEPPAASAAEGGLPQDARWFEGRVATSMPVRGDELATAEAASARCAAEFGAGWRIAKWNDPPGDGFIARGTVRGDSRSWIDVPGREAANCWPASR